MEKVNGSVTEFWLKGLTDDPLLRKWIFFCFLVIYVLTIIGNVILIVVWANDPRLQTPMYFFLVNLAVLDIGYSTAIVPNTLVQLVARSGIPFYQCAAQMFAHLLLGCGECILLAVMAYDRYVAVSFPLRYGVIMSRSVCTAMAAFSWVSGLVMAFLDTIFTLRLPLCGANVINHFYCESATVLKMACVDTFISEMVMFSVAAYVLLIPSVVVLISYTRIVITIIGIRSSQGRYKAFSTSASHLIVVTMMYGTAIFQYAKPGSKGTAHLDKMVSVFYTVIPPMINPMIYSLRNKDVKMALKKVAGRRIHH